MPPLPKPPGPGRLAAPNQISYQFNAQFVAGATVERPAGDPQIFSAPRPSTVPRGGCRTALIQPAGPSAP